MILKPLKHLFIQGREEGQSLVELALVLPILITILLGIIQFGAVFNGLVVVNAAAREGARAEAVSEDGAAAANAVCQGAVFLSECNPSIEKDESTVTVTVTGEVPLLLPFLNQQFNLRGKSVMRLELEPDTD